MTEQRFTIAVPDEAIDDLNRRLRQTRWPDTVTGSGWTYGLDVNWMKSMADYWLSTYPGSEVAVLLAMARVLLDEELYDRAFVERWVNWEDYLRAERADLEPTFDSFILAIKERYAEFTPEYAEQESGVAAATIVEIARLAGRAGSAFSTHVWRGAASGHLGGWQGGNLDRDLRGMVWRERSRRNERRPKAAE